eukprot:scaffold7381_cov310-Pinguiococcus_pyrenoidosus.AAC.53
MKDREQTTAHRRQLFEPLGNRHCVESCGVWNHEEEDRTTRPRRERVRPRRLLHVHPARRRLPEQTCACGSPTSKQGKVVRDWAPVLKSCQPSAFCITNSAQKRPWVDLRLLDAS